MNEIDKELMERVFNPEFLKKLETEKGEGPTIESLKNMMSKRTSRRVERFIIVLLVFLKLTGCVTWSWWIVTIPLWYRLIVAMLELPGIVYNVVKILLLPKGSAKKDLAKVIFKVMGVEPKNYNWDALAEELEKKTNQKEETPKTDVPSEDKQDNNA